MQTNIKLYYPSKNYQNFFDTIYTSFQDTDGNIASEALKIINSIVSLYVSDIANQIILDHPHYDRNATEAEIYRSFCASGMLNGFENRE